MKSIRNILFVASFALVVALLAGQANAAMLSMPRFAYTYSYPGDPTIAGPGGEDEAANPSILNDGFFTTQEEIDEGTATAGYYLNGGNPPGFIFGTGAGNNRSVTFDLGSVQTLGAVDMYYVAHGPDAVDAPWQVDVVIDGGTPISFNPFDISPTVNVQGPQARAGDARMSTVNLTGQSGQIITLDFYSDGRTDLAGGGAQSCCGGEWTGLNEVAFLSDVVLLGDFNDDTEIDSVDAGILRDHLNAHLDGVVGYENGDIDFDSDVDLDDFGLFKEIFNALPASVTGAPVPEPSSVALSLCVLAGLVAVARRRGR